MLKTELHLVLAEKNRHILFKICLCHKEVIKEYDSLVNHVMFYNSTHNPFQFSHNDRANKLLTLLTEHVRS